MNQSSSQWFINIVCLLSLTVWFLMTLFHIYVFCTVLWKFGFPATCLFNYQTQPPLTLGENWFNLLHRCKNVCKAEGYEMQILYICRDSWQLVQLDDSKVIQNLVHEWLKAVCFSAGCIHYGICSKGKLKLTKFVLWNGNKKPLYQAQDFIHFTIPLLDSPTFLLSFLSIPLCLCTFQKRRRELYSWILSSSTKITSQLDLEPSISTHELINRFGQIVSNHRQVSRNIIITTPQESEAWFKNHRIIES